MKGPNPQIRTRLPLQGQVLLDNRPILDQVLRFRVMRRKSSAILDLYKVLVIAIRERAYCMLTFGELCDALKGHSEMVWIQETGWVIKKFNILMVCVKQARDYIMLKRTLTLIVTIDIAETRFWLCEEYKSRGD